MSYSWFRQGTCSVVNGSDTVRFIAAGITTSELKPVIGDAFTINNSKLYEVIFIGSDATGEYIKLKQAFGEATISNVSYALIRLASSTQNARLVAMAAAAINQKQISLDDMFEWYTSTADTVEFLGIDGSPIVIPTYSKITKDVTLVGGNSAAISTVSANISAILSTSANVGSIQNVSDNISSIQNLLSVGAIRTKEQDEAMRSANNNLYAASGFEHFGKDYAVASHLNKVGEGLWTVEDAPNVLALGRGVDPSGSSASDCAVINIAGVSSKLSKIATFDINQAFAIFPEAEKGTRTYDSATGVSFDFATQVDPKYGDVAATKNEAVARAFEGVVTNGDMRNGSGEWSPYASGVFTLNNGVARYERVSVEGLCQVTNNVYWHSLLHNKNCTVTIEVFAGGGDFIIQSSKVSLYKTLKVGHNEFSFYNDDLTGMTALIRLGDTIGAFCEFGAMSVRASTNRVVTDREDVWGFEQWLENVTEANPYVYPNGLVQSKAADINGVATSRSNRPITYYSAFTGDTTSDGKGVNWFTATDAEKKAMASDPDNNLLYDPVSGNVQQWRVRQRTFAGAGNGDWDQVDSTIKNALRFDSNILIKSQGALDDSLPANSSWGTNTFFGTGTVDFGSSEVGVFASKVGDTSSSVNGECYFLVCGTVSRLNQGAYHPSFNPSGTKLSLEDGQYWWATTQPYTSVLSTFLRGHPASGLIGQGSGRHDGRVYNAIYASGQGGVCRDMRYSAFGLEQSDFSVADAKAKKGVLRGYEKQVRTELFDFTLKDTSTYGGGFYYRFNEEINPAKYAKRGTAIYFPRTGLLGFVCVPELYDNGAVYVCTNKRDSLLGLVGLNPLSNAPFQIGDRAIVIHEVELESQVGGDFLHTDVVGNPAQLLLTPALSSGWVGSWIGAIPNGISGGWPASRKSVGNIQKIITGNNGASWVVGSLSLDSVSNSFEDGATPANEILLYTYIAKAKMTKVSPIFSVKYGAAGFGEVFAYAYYNPERGGFLCESTLGLILKDTTLTSVHAGGSLINRRLNEVGRVDSAGWGYPTHTPLTFGVPDSSGFGFKVVNAAVEENGQGFVGYFATALSFDGTDWGDDGLIHAAPNESYLIDLNGEYLRTSTHTLKEPIGWVKNKI